MDLKEFVAESLRQIVEGVKEAQITLKDGIINPGIAPMWTGELGKKFAIQNGRIIEAVEFDIAVTVVDQENSKKGLAVFAGWLGVGGQKEAAQSNTSFSRIKFSLPIAYPQQP